MSMALDGLFITQMQGGVESDFRSVSSSITPTAYDLFRSSWISALQDSDFVQYAHNKLPQALVNYDWFNESNPLFSPTPGAFRPFIYDAVLAMGISMCRAGNGTDYFTGQRVLEQFATLDFFGASERVQLTSSGTRNYSSVTFVAFNTRSVSVDGENMTVVDARPSFSFVNSTWVNLNSSQVYFAGGGETPPPDLPPLEYDYNYIGGAARGLAYSLMGSALLSSVGSVLWIIMNRKSVVVESAHPLFLVLVTLGTFIMASAIIPLSLEETLVQSMAGLDTACMFAPWLYVIGFTLVVSPLASKALRIYKVC
jgi:hypothetical protein